MENNGFKKVRIKNCACYYFDVITKLEDFNIDNILIYDISYKNLIYSKPLRIRFDKIDGFIRIYDVTRYLTVFDSEKYDATYDKIKYLISLKSSTTHIFSHFFAKIKVDSYDSLPIEKRLTLHSVITLIKWVFNENKNHYYYKIFWEKCFYQLAKK